MFPQTFNPCGELTSRTLDPNPASLRGWGRSEAAGREPVSAQLSYNKAGSSVGNQTNSKDEIELLCYRGGVALINHWLRPGLEVDPAVPRRSKLSKTQCCFYLTSTVHNSSCTTTWSKHILHSLPCAHRHTTPCIPVPNALRKAHTASQDAIHTSEKHGEANEGWSMGGMDSTVGNGQHREGTTHILSIPPRTHSFRDFLFLF